MRDCFVGLRPPRNDTNGSTPKVLIVVLKKWVSRFVGSDLVSDRIQQSFLYKAAFNNGRTQGPPLQRDYINLDVPLTKSGQA